MLEWIQQQVIADALYGLEPDVDPNALDEPWSTMLHQLPPLDPDEKHDVERFEGNYEQRRLWVATVGLGSIAEREALCESVLTTLRSDSRRYPTLHEIADTLPEIDWLWQHWIPRGMLSLLGAAPGVGKSLLALDLAHRIVDNRTFPDDSTIPEPGRPCLYVDAEAIPQLHQARASSWDMDTKRLYLMLPQKYGMIDFGAEHDRDRLVKMMDSIEPALVVIDSLSTISIRGENNVEDVRTILGFLANAAREHACAILLIHHLRKRSATPLLDMVTIDDFRGSSHIMAMSRSVLGLSTVQDQAEFNRDGPRRLEIIKTNLCKHPPALGVIFDEFAPDQVRLNYSPDVPQPYREPTTIEQCEAWLIDLLEDANEPLKPGDVLDLAEEAGFTEATTYRARKKLEGTIVNTADKKHSHANRWTLAAEESDDV